MRPTPPASAWMWSMRLAQKPAPKAATPLRLFAARVFERLAQQQPRLLA